MFHPFEVDETGEFARNDLPDFKEPIDVATFLTNNKHVSERDGKFVRLDWKECMDPKCGKCSKVMNGGW